MSCPVQNFEIVRGDTFERTLRWEDSLFTTKAITGLTSATPPVVTAVSHGVPNGWRVAVVGLPLLPEVNSDVENLNKLRDTDYKIATTLTENTLALRDVNAASMAAWSAGGYLVYKTPVDLAGYSARMDIRETVDSDPIIELTSSAGIAIDNTEKTIIIVIADSVTEAVTIDTAVYDLEMVSGSGKVTKILKGTIRFTDEVTRVDV